MTRTRGRAASEKRTKLPRDSQKFDNFVKDWEKLERSGKHDMNVVKEAMMLLVANDEPLPAEWRDHKLNGIQNLRECHVKGDLLLLYRIVDDNRGGVVLFHRVGTHSEIF